MSYINHVFSRKVTLETALSVRPFICLTFKTKDYKHFKHKRFSSILCFVTSKASCTCSNVPKEVSSEMFS